MLKISVNDTARERQLILAGVLSSAWVAELRNTWNAAQRQIEHRVIVLDMKDVTLIGSDGEELLLEMIRNGAKFRGGGVYVGHLLRELEMKSRKDREIDM